MVRVYAANSTIDAHLIRNLLAQHGIEAFVAGHYLQGALGELPVINMIEVQVDAADESQARQIIANYEAGDYAIGDDEV